MSPLDLVPIAEKEIDGLPLWLAGAVNLRRDLYLFVKFVEREGLKRSYRDNLIPKGPALKLARILSWAGEAAYVRSQGAGGWSDDVSELALSLGLVKFDVKGVYAGYTSSEPCFPDNEIEVDEKRFRAWLGRTPLEKEQAILGRLIEETSNEFFNAPRFTSYENRFNMRGSATGPASRMPLPTIRQKLLRLLAELPAGVWFPVSGLIERLRATAPALILDPSLRKAPLSDWELSDMKRGRKVQERIDEAYCNFSEKQGSPDSNTSFQLTETTPNAFARVEGRYAQYFLQGIPYLCGFVDLAIVEAHEEKVYPPLESVRAFRTTPRLRQLMTGDPALNRVSVTVLPNFDVLVEAPSWPERELDALSPFCARRKEDGPIHTLHIETGMITAHAAKNPEDDSPLETLAGLCKQPIPHNVEVEIEAALGHSEKLTIYEKVALVEFRNPQDGESIVSELEKLVFDNRPAGFVLSRRPDETFAILEQRLRVPRLVKHSERRFAATDGPLGISQPKVPTPPAPRRRKARLQREDLVGYRANDEALLIELQKAVDRAGGSGRLLAGEKLLIVSAAHIPLIRSALEKLAVTWDVEAEKAGAKTPSKKPSDG